MKEVRSLERASSLFSNQQLVFVLPPLFPQLCDHIQQSPCFVIALFPDARLGVVRDSAIALDGVKDSAELFVDLMISDELPLLLKSFRVRIRFPAVLLVHQQQGI